MTTRKVLSFSACVFAIVASLLAATASADIVFDRGNQQHHNVNFSAHQIAWIVDGQTEDGYNVYFQNGIDPDGTPIQLHAQHGDALVENAADEGQQNPQYGFTSLTMLPDIGYGWTAGDFKLDALRGSEPGSVTFNAIDHFGQAYSIDFALDLQGEDPYQFYSTDGCICTSIVFSVPITTPLADMKQVSLDTTPVPEPSALVLLISGTLGLLGLAWRRKR